MAKTVVGLFDDYSDAQAAVRDLESAGFTHDHISVVASNAGNQFGSASDTTNGSSMAGGVVSGTVKGAAEGAVIGGLTGLAASVALFLIPGVGPVLGAGALAATLGGAGLGAAGGGVIGGLSRLGIPHEEAGYYAEGVRRGGTLVTVQADDNNFNQAADILNDHNAVDVHNRADYYKTTGYTGYSEAAPAYTPNQIESDRTQYATLAPTTAMSNTTMARDTDYAATPATPAPSMGGATRTVEAGETVTVPIVQEELAVGKRAVERGGARIHTFVTETPVSEQVTLREEHVTIDRNPVNRAVTDADMAFREGTIEVTERGEEAVVAKTARVVEEVVIGKEATERTETVSDTVRRTDVDVEELDTDDVTTATTGATTGTTTRY